jgi:hypothetical protein
MSLSKRTFISRLSVLAKGEAGENVMIISPMIVTNMSFESSALNLSYLRVQRLREWPRRVV